MAIFLPKSGQACSCSRVHCHLHCFIDKTVGSNYRGLLHRECFETLITDMFRTKIGVDSNYPVPKYSFIDLVEAARVMVAPTDELTTLSQTSNNYAYYSDTHVLT